MSALPSSSSSKRLSKILDHTTSTADENSQSQIRKQAVHHTAKIQNTKNSLKGKTIFITGGSRGIGLAVALRCARDGCNVVIAAKTATLHPKLPGTIYTAAKQIEDAGGQALAVVCDVRSEEAVKEAVQKAVDRFGGIDILVNNASAISLTRTQDTAMKKYDLMHQVNLRGTFMVTKCCLPYLKKSDNPHILVMSPPLSTNKTWYAGHVAYTMAKMGMTMCVAGWSQEFRRWNIAANTLWPRTAIATAAVKNILGGDAAMSRSRTPEIMADSAYMILIQSSKMFNGQYCVDEEILRDAGVTDFRKYNVDPSVQDKDLLLDFFLD